MNLVFGDIFKESEIFRRISKEAVRIISFLNGLGSPAYIAENCYTLKKHVVYFATRQLLTPLQTSHYLSTRMLIVSLN